MVAIYYADTSLYETSGRFDHAHLIRNIRFIDQPISIREVLSLDQ